MNEKKVSLDQELDDFIRWLAIMPQHLKTFYSTPEVIMHSQRLSPEARNWVREVGVQHVVKEAKKTLNSIVGDPETWQRSEFTRDRSIRGYGGVIKESGQE
jgi:hypothetical protein